MDTQPLSGTSDNSVWIITIALLVLGALIGVGSLALFDANTRAQIPAAPQAAPTR